MFDIPLLSQEEELELARAWKQRQCKASLDKLVLAHARIARAAATRFKSYGIAEQELAQAGLLGLQIAAHHFDPERGVRFLHYARLWVAETIRDCIVTQYSTIRMPERDMRKALFGKGSKGQGEGLKQIITVPIPEEQDDTDLRLRATPVDNRPTPEEHMIRRSTDQRLQTWVNDALARLAPREAEVARMRLLKEPPLTAAAAAAVLGISPSRLRQIERSALDKITRSFHEFAARDGEKPLPNPGRE